MTDTRTHWSSAGCYIGRAVEGNRLNSYLDEFRIFKGEAYYSADFTPPTTRF